MADQYNGSVGLAAGIVAKGGTFPLVNETDIYVSGDPTGTWTNLTSKLSDMQDDIDSKASSSDLPTDTNQTTTWQSVSFGANATVNIVQGANIAITANATTNTATISVSGLATVATSGAYSDLSDKPTLATVATSGKYTDLDLTGAPVVNDATLTIQRNNSDIGTFSANSATNATINIDVPTVYDWAKSETKPSYDLDEIADTENYVKMTPAEKTKLSSVATVATTGSYNDLTDQPVIPTVNNATINIQVGGVTQGSFSLNQSSGESINLLVATADEIRELFNKYKEDNS